MGPKAHRVPREIGFGPAAWTYTSQVCPPSSFHALLSHQFCCTVRLLNSGKSLPCSTPNSQLAIHVPNLSQDTTASRLSRPSTCGRASASMHVRAHACTQAEAHSQRTTDVKVSRGFYRSHKQRDESLESPQPAAPPGQAFGTPGPHQLQPVPVHVHLQPYTKPPHILSHILPRHQMRRQFEPSALHPESESPPVGAGAGGRQVA